MKTILYKGIFETNRNKFIYQHYIPKEINEEVEDIETQDFLFDQLNYIKIIK